MEEKTTKKTTATKAAAEKKTTKAAPKTTRTAAKKTAAKEVVTYVNAENAGFRAGDIYQVLAAAGVPMTVAELVKATKVSAENVYLGLGWLLKEGKVASTEDNKVVLA